ncbi:hypothetical protein [Rhodopseudomonas pseudopalustris]|uniref:Uncharacterized protein n=1 Tax=Rhodopseudomonas pseudopalustris TaxID=1513892 RepID=A0A1H8Q2M2_9BRAD|nr:hypothetical protein [Rhodopseudomonas pseudopalustris]SEO48495.1 hypothetical protein SAMN05444123_10332 [Rhodopseudomonas pseudopalustris]
MTAIANYTSPFGQPNAPAGPASGSAAGASATDSATTKTTTQGAAATVVTLSDRAKAVLDKANADKAAAADLTLSFDEILQKRSDALTSKLTKAFSGLNVNLDEAVRLQVDKFGNVTTEGPWKAKIEEFFAKNPDLAKELKAIAGLNALRAANTAVDLYNKEKGPTADSKQQQRAWTDYTIRSMNIQTLSGVMSLQDGKLRSAAADYIDTLADPTGAKAGPDPVQRQREIASRLA